METAQYRHSHRGTPEHVRLEDHAEDDMMAIRLPIASTGQVRNEGDDPLTTGELRGMAEQVDNLSTGIFPDHGLNGHVSGGHYSQLEKLGYWSDGEVVERGSADDEDLLIATANMPDPDTLPAATGSYREALAVYKEQAKRGIPMDASIGWREDENFAGGNDLMEASIVGIGADPRTTTDADTVALTRAALDAGADPDTLLDTVREITEQHDMTEDTDPDEPGTDTDEQNADDGETREFESRMLEMQERQTELLETLTEQAKDGEDDDEDEEEDDEDEQAAEEPDESQESDDTETETQESDDPDDTQDAEQDGDESDLQDRVDRLESELSEAREAMQSEGADAVDTPEPDSEQNADSDESDESTTERAGDSGPSFGFAPTNTED